MRARCYLYVPGDSDEKLAKSSTRGADALILDLEDSVPGTAKTVARAKVRDWLLDRGPHPSDTPEAWVRINADPSLWRDDLEAVLGAPLTGIVVPKATPESLGSVAGQLEAGGHGSLRVACLVETAESVRRIDEIARAPWVSHLGIGEADLRAELGIEPSEHEVELAAIRSAVVVASAAAGIAAPVGPTSTDFRDLEALRKSTVRLRRLGFRGRTAIHPAQVPVIQEAFTPTADRIAAARDVLDRYAAAVEAGRGVATDAQGRMIDEAVVRAARRTMDFVGDDDG